MAKLTALTLLFFFAAVAVASTSAYKADQCESGVELKSCLEWAKNAPFAVGALLRSRVAAEEYLEECCEELRQLSSDICRCSVVHENMLKLPFPTSRTLCTVTYKCGMSCACPR